MGADAAIGRLGNFFFFLLESVESRALTKCVCDDIERRGGRRAQEEKSLPQVLLPRNRP